MTHGVERSASRSSGSHGELDGSHPISRAMRRSALAGRGARSARTIQSVDEDKERVLRRVTQALEEPGALLRDAGRGRAAHRGEA